MNMFKPTSGVHSYNVRGASKNIFVPTPRTEAAKRAFSYRGAVMWNGLENETRRRDKSQLFQVCPVFVLNQGLPWGSWDRTYFSYIMYI